MADWPVNSIGPPAYGMSERYWRPTIRTDFEGGYVQQRPRATRGLRQWDLSWPLMPEAQAQTFLTFAKSAMGSTFPFPHPVTEIGTVTCRFAQDTVEASVVQHGYRYVKAWIEEV